MNPYRVRGSGDLGHILWRRWVTARSQIKNSWDSPREAAHSVRRLVDPEKWHCQLPTMKSLCSKLGVLVRVESGFPADVRCFLDEHPFVDVQQRLALEDRRAAVAHSLWHVLTASLRHPRECTCPNFISPADRDCKEADDFAACLLAPLYMVESVVSSRRRTAAQLAELFGVPVWLMVHQLRKFLGLV